MCQYVESLQLLDHGADILGFYGSRTFTLESMQLERCVLLKINYMFLFENDCY